MARAGLRGAGGSQETPLFCPGKGLQGRLSGGTRGGGLDGDLSRGVIGTGVEGETRVRGQRSRASIFEPFIHTQGSEGTGIMEKEEERMLGKLWHEPNSAPNELFLLS